MTWAEFGVLCGVSLAVGAAFTFAFYMAARELVEWVARQQERHRDW